MVKHITLTVVLLVVSSLVSGEVPEICNGYQCPAYTVVESNDVYELRAYDASTWVAATGEGGSQRGLFMDCFRYITGSNDAELKIDMTVPVLKKYSVHDAGVDNEAFTAFYLPMNDPPQPDADNVQIVQMPPMRVYVKSYGFWSSESKVQTNLEELLDALPLGVSVDLDNAYYAGYSAPWKMFGRHNEVWLIEQ